MIDEFFTSKDELQRLREENEELKSMIKNLMYELETEQEIIGDMTIHYNKMLNFIGKKIEILKKVKNT